MTRAINEEEVLRAAHLHDQHVALERATGRAVVEAGGDELQIGAVPNHGERITQKSSCPWRIGKRMRRLEQRTVPAGNVSGGKKLGAPVPLFPKDCAELPGESDTVLDSVFAIDTNPV